MRYLILFLLGLAPQILEPGAPEIASDHFRDETQVLRLLKADSEIGPVREDWRLVASGNLLLITTGQQGNRSYIDSAIVRRRGLAPISEMFRFGSTEARFTYDGAKVTYTRTTPDSGTRRVEHTYAHNVFNFQELDDLLRSLPLRAGYERILPLYSEGSDTLEMDTARVVSQATDGRWTIRFADPAIVASYQVDGRTRRIVSHEFVLRRTGVRYRYLEGLASSSN